MECGEGMQQGQRQAMRQRQIAEERSITHSQYSLTNANPPPNIQHRQIQPQLRQQQQIHHSQQEIKLPHVAQQFNPLQMSRQQAQSSQVQQGQAPQSTQQHKQPQVHSKAAQQQPQTAQQLLQKTHVTQGQPQMQQSYNAPQLQSQQAAATQSIINQTENLETQGVIEAEMLQLKLKKESDKLINWKVQQMFTISNLEQSLKESEEIRERQKKNIFDLQMQLEKDIQNRQHDAKISESLMEKVQNTRSMCKVLHGHCRELTESLQNCYNAKDEVTLNQDSLNELVVELSEKIQNVESMFTKKVEHLESVAIKKQELHKQELHQCRNVQTTLEKKVEDLESQLHKESTVREELKRNLTVSSKQIQDLAKAKEKFQLETQQKLNNAFSMIKAKDDIISEKGADITKLKGELERMKSLENELFTLKLAHQKICFEKTVLSDKLDISTNNTLSLETKIKDMEYRLEESSSRNRSFETQLGDLQEANDALTSRFGQYTATQQDLEQEISQLKSQLQDKSDELENLQSNHTSETENLKSVIQSRWDEIQKVASDLKEATDERIGIEEQLVEKNDLIRNLQEECDNLKMQSEMKEQEMSELTRISEVQREEKTDIEKLLSAKSEEIMKLCKDLEDAHTEQEEWKVKFEKLEIEMSEQNDKTSHEWENKWKAAIKEKDQALIESQLMVDKIKKDVEVRLQSELDKLNKIKEDVIQSSAKEIGDIVNEKDTIIEELREIIKNEKESKENEVMILKKQLENVTSSRSEEINKLKSDMKVLQQEKSEYIQKAKKELEDSKAESSAKLKDIMRLMTIEDKELRSQLVLKDKELSSVQSNLASNEKEVRALTEKIAELGKNNKDLTLEKKHQEELNKNMKEELNHLMKKLNRLEENNLIGVAKPIASSTPIINHGSSPTESALKINKRKEIESPVPFDDLSSRSILKSPMESLNIGNDHSKKKVVFDISENENSDASIDISTLKPRNRKRFNKTKFNEKDGSYPIKKNRDVNMANSSVFAKPITHSVSKMPHDRVFKNVSKANEGNTLTDTQSKRKQPNKFFRNRPNKDDSSPSLDFDFLFN
uniref:Uncharacterized protein n=1 Tax=Timema cristinae TaxID=61476 RepID=A0A7R9CNG5_TIMCR|nr:unnamed protein product [Timema cristinae]